MRYRELIDDFFELTDNQKTQIDQLYDLYIEWNEKINVVSRKDANNLYLHHVLHSLSIAKFIQFVPTTHILDLGTGGGFPGVPLAILFPECDFTLIDGTLKKIKVVNEVAQALKLTNIQAKQLRAEECKDSFDFVVSRAVAKIALLKQWSFPLIHEDHKNKVPNGLICLKGGNLKKELAELSKKDSFDRYSINKYFNRPYFEEKQLIYLQR